MSTATEQMIQSHKQWFEEALGQLQRRLDELEQREKRVAESEAWINARRERIEKAIANA
jgi:hypothetical protein